MTVPDHDLGRDKFVIGVLQIGSGASLGREGPTVQICVGISSTIGRLTALSRDNMRRLVPVSRWRKLSATWTTRCSPVDDIGTRQVASLRRIYRPATIKKYVQLV
ncbi:MAG: chloride channel protein, partial [Acidimicrobiales bacterium]